MVFLDPAFEDALGASKGKSAAEQALLAELAHLVSFSALASAVCSLLTTVTGARRLLLAWAAAELVYFAYHRYRYHVANQVCYTMPDPARVAVVKARFLELGSVISLDQFLSGWFHGLPADQICRGNVEDFVAYGFYCTTMDKLPGKLQQLTREFVDECERRWGLRLPPGHNPAARFMAHLFEPLRVVPKPLVVHLASEAAGLAAHAWLAAKGFRRLTHAGMTYWIRPPQQGAAAGIAAGNLAARGSCQAADTRAILFLHGVGFGIAPYLHFVSGLCASYPQHPIICAEFAHVALRVRVRAAPIDQLAHALAGVLALHGYADACVVAHSFGTFVASRLRQLHPKVAHSLVLLDPVCMMTCYPLLLHSFVYKTPTLRSLARGLGGVVDAARFFCSRDLSIAQAFCRNFLWHELMLWPEDMPAACLLALSELDDLVSAPLVRAQLAAARSPALVMERAGAGHAAMLFDHPWQAAILAAMRDLLAGEITPSPPSSPCRAPHALAATAAVCT